jgi:hypothetical protein
MGNLPPDRLKSASGLFALMRNLGGAISIADEHSDGWGERSGRHRGLVLEGNVVEAIAWFLANTARRSSARPTRTPKSAASIFRARRYGQMLLLEAKDYPSKNYRDPTRRGG